MRADLGEARIGLGLGIVGSMNTDTEARPSDTPGAAPARWSRQ
jgi:hypothetical protein